MTVQCPHDADPREHRRASERRDQDQAFHCGLPFLDLVNGLRKLGDVGAGISKRLQRPAIWERNRIVETPLPSFVRHQAEAARRASWSQ